MIAERRSQVERRLRHLLFLSNRERLTHLLLDLAEQYGEPGEGPSDRFSRLSCPTRISLTSLEVLARP